jgi:pimeloyl-ACP methyl ester carboxylesterase
MESRTISVLGLRTRVLVDGARAEGDAVVAIHGVGGWAENWSAVTGPLAATGRPVVALDLPGFGESERPRRVRYFAPEDAFYPRFVLAVMDELGLARAHVIGNSMGGTIAAMVALTAPERVRSVVFAPGGGLGLEVAWTLRACSLPGMTLFARLPFPRSAVHASVQSLFYDLSRIPSSMYEESERYCLRSFPEFVRAMAAGLDLRGIRPALRDAWLARIGSYAGPMLVVWGREDRVIPVDQVRVLRTLLPRAEVRIIDRCGHLPMIECPDEFLAAVVPFIERAERAVAA